MRWRGEIKWLGEEEEAKRRRPRGKRVARWKGEKTARRRNEEGDRKRLGGEEMRVGFSWALNTPQPQSTCSYYCKNKLTHSYSSKSDL